MISTAGAVSFRVAVGLVSLEEAGMLLNLVSKEEKAVILTSLLKLSEAGFALVPPNTLKDYPSLELFWQPYKRLSSLLMEMAAYEKHEDILSLIKIISKSRPYFEDEIRPNLLFFEEIIYLTDLEMQVVLRKEGLSPFILIDTSPELTERLLKNISGRVKKDAQLRLDELNSMSEIEKIINSKTALRYKATLVKAVLKMRAEGVIDGPHVPLTLSELSTIEQRISQIVSHVSTFDDDAFSLWLAERIIWDDLAALYYWGPAEFREKLENFLSRPMREAIYKNAPAKEQKHIVRKEAEAIFRLRKSL